MTHQNIAYNWNIINILSSLTHSLLLVAPRPSLPPHRPTLPKPSLPRPSLPRPTLLRPSLPTPIGRHGVRSTTSSQCWRFNAASRATRLRRLDTKRLRRPRSGSWRWKGSWTDEIEPSVCKWSLNKGRSCFASHRRTTHSFMQCRYQLPTCQPADTIIRLPSSTINCEKKLQPRTNFSAECINELTTRVACVLLTCTKMIFTFLLDFVVIYSTLFTKHNGSI